MQGQRRVSAQAFVGGATDRGIARPAGQRAGHFERDERRSVQAQPLHGNRAQKGRAPLVKAVARVEGGDPVRAIETATPEGAPTPKPPDRLPPNGTTAELALDLARADGDARGGALG
jgi:hypothetical protein